MLTPITKSHHLSDPIAACGDRVYLICSQNGLFPDPWGGHVPGEMWGVWDHPIKLLDGFWFGISTMPNGAPQWLIEASECRAGVGNNEFDYRYGPLRITRRDAVPDGVEGLIVTLTLQADEPIAAPITLYALFRSDLCPAWLGEQAGMHDGQDIARLGSGIVFTDALNPWHCIVGADARFESMGRGGDLWSVQHTSGQGTSAQIEHSLRVEPGQPETITFFVAGSTVSEARALATFDQLQAQHAQLLDEKQARYTAMLAASRVTTPDATLNEAMAWSKVINQMLARRVPPYGIGAGAGLPEYPWWFGIDSAYAVLPMLQSGQFDLVRDTLRLLKWWSLEHNEQEPGRVLHEMSTTGVVYNAGNMVEVPTFTRAVHQYWLWTGDRAFLEEMYPFCKQGVLDYALGAQDPDGDLCPSGRSIIETLEMHAGFEVVDVAAYTCEALARLSDMAQALGEGEVAADAQRKAGQLAERIRTEWWLEDEGLFADVRATVDQLQVVLNHLAQIAGGTDAPPDLQRQVQRAQRLFEPNLDRHRGQPRDADLPWLLKHWVVMCPVEVGLATPSQAERVLQRLQSSEFYGEWGMYLHPIQHDAMSINTGILALCAARYGHVDDALSVVQTLIRSFSYRTPGAVGEALPDKWCFLQLWSNLGLVAPMVEGFLGIEPRAGERKLRIAPYLPAAWKQAKVEQLRVGDAHMDIAVVRQSHSAKVTITGAQGWTLEAGMVLPPNTRLKSANVNGQPATWRMEQTLRGPCVVCDYIGNCELVLAF